MNLELPLFDEYLPAVWRSANVSCIAIFTRKGIYSRLNLSIQYHFFKDVMDMVIYRVS